MNRLTRYIPERSRPHIPLFVAICLSLLMLAYFIYTQRTVMAFNGDTMSYVNAWDNCLSKGEIDVFRTPVCPLLIGLGRMLFGQEHWGWLLFGVQFIAFYGSGLLLSRMSRKIVDNRYAAWAVVFLYLMYYPAVRTIATMGTESLAVSLTTVWIYCVWQFMCKTSWRYGLTIALLTAVSIMLRPSFLLLPYAVIGVTVFGVFMKRWRRTVLLLLAAMLPSMAICKVYADEVERKVGLNTLSTVSTFNLYYMARQYNDIFPEFLTDNPGAIEQMQKYHKSGGRLTWTYHKPMWDEIWTNESEGIMNYPDMYDYSVEVMKHYPGLWIEHIGIRIGDSFPEFGTFRMLSIYLTVLLSAIIFPLAWIRYRRISMINLLLLLITGGNMLMSFLFAPFDYARLMLPSLSVMLILVGEMVACIEWRPLSFSLSHLFPNDKKSQTK